MDFGYAVALILYFFYKSLEQKVGDIFQLASPKKVCHLVSPVAVHVPKSCDEIIVKCVEKGRCRLRVAGSGLTPTCSCPMCPCSAFMVPFFKALRSWSYGEARVWYSKPEWQPAATGGKKVQGRQPQHEPLELAWRHISKSWLGPSLHSGGVRTILCFSPPLCLPMASENMAPVPWAAYTQGVWVKKLFSSLPPGLWVGGCSVLCPSTLWGTVRVLLDPKMQSDVQLCFFLRPNRFPGKPLCPLASEPQCPPRGRNILLSEKSHHSRLHILWCFSGWRNLLESHICPLPWASQDAVSWWPAPFQGRSPLLIQKRRDARPSFSRSLQTSLAPGVVKGGGIQSEP